MSKKSIVTMGGGKIRTTEVDEAPVREDNPNARELLNREKRLIQKYEDQDQLLYPIEQIARDKVMIGNVKYPGADEDWPEDHMALFRFCTRVYPNAAGGPLFADFPRDDREVHRAYERQRKIKERNDSLEKGKKIRHVIVEKETSYMDLLSQLGED